MDIILTSHNIHINEDICSFCVSNNCMQFSELQCLYYTQVKAVIEENNCAIKDDFNVKLSNENITKHVDEVVFDFIETGLYRSTTSIS